MKFCVFTKLVSSFSVSSMKPCIHYKKKLGIIKNQFQLVADSVCQCHWIDWLHNNIKCVNYAVHQANPFGFEYQRIGPHESTVRLVKSSGTWWGRLTFLGKFLLNSFTEIRGQLLEYRLITEHDEQGIKWTQVFDKFDPSDLPPGLYAKK